MRTYSMSDGVLVHTGGERVWNQQCAVATCARHASASEGASSGFCPVTSQVASASQRTIGRHKQDLVIEYEQQVIINRETRRELQKPNGGG